ncbi:4Fe-4S binding protein [Desulfovibrio sp. UCD-KL4C]|uniref:4Fe-4S binding protein n=1 Tax=Desulfovibrio sp. UCD-KL4C TaxID=2578120 RepID=UPI0025C5C5CB|nr:4Fe-4S binding protein [Desulfovibrio sp. UCD-KL4C]
MNGSSSVAVNKPGAVEGFLPISALLSFKQLITNGIYDEVHPAGLTIFIAVLVMSLLLRKGFCGYLCPIGFVSNLLSKLGRKTKHIIKVTGKIEFVLLIPKYIAGAFFLNAVFFKMGPRATSSFIHSSFNYTGEARMLHFFTHLGLVSALVIASIVILCIFIPYFWCRFLCPYGALLGVISKLSPIAVKRNQDLCIKCGKCSKVCPGGIQVETKTIINSSECIGCTQCIGSCPVNDCLTLTDRLSRKRRPWATIAIGCVFILMLYYVTAVVTNHWDSPLPNEMLRRYYINM